MSQPIALRVPVAALTAALFFYACPASTATAEPPLTLREAQRRAIERSQQVTAQDAAVTASREMAVAAAQLPDPVGKVGINNLPVNGPDAFSVTRDFMTMRSIGVMQEFTRAEKREARAERFEREAEQSLAQRVVTVTSIQRDTGLAWLDRYYAEAMLRVLAEEQRSGAAEIEAAESSYRAGRGALADVLAARSALAGLDDRESELRRRVRTAKVTLARWIGDETDAPLGDAPDTDHDPLDPATLETNLAHHPELAVMTAKEDLAAAEVRVAQTNKKPDWSVEVMYSQRGPSYSNMVSVNLSVPLQWDRRNRQDREVAAKMAMLDQARAERNEVLRARVAEIRSMMGEWQSGRERMTRYRQQIVPLAGERTRALLGGYRGARNGLADVLMARRNEIDVRLQALQLELETARLWAQLAYIYPTDASYRGLLPSGQEKP